MTTPAHIATGLLLAHAFTHFNIVPAGYEQHAITIAILAANAPDIDALALWRVLRHRSSPFHKPVLWFLFIGPLLLYTNFAELSYQFSVMLLIAAGVGSHFLLDSIDMSPGIQWLWPFTKKRYHFWKKTMPDSASLKDVIKAYKKNPMLLADLAYSFFTYFLYKRMG